MKTKLIAICFCLTIFGLFVIANEPIPADCKAKLQSLIQKYHSKAKVEKENNRLLYRYHTKIFNVQKKSQLKEKSYDVEDPNTDGILVHATIRKGTYSGAAKIPQTLNRPNWQTFINAYPVNGNQYIWLSISYGSKSDKKLIKALKTCFGPLFPQKSGTKNKTIQKAQQKAP